MCSTFSYFMSIAVWVNQCNISIMIMNSFCKQQYLWASLLFFWALLPCPKFGLVKGTIFPHLGNGRQLSIWVLRFSWLGRPYTRKDNECHARPRSSQPFLRKFFMLDLSSRTIDLFQSRSESLAINTMLVERGGGHNTAS